MEAIKVLCRTYEEYRGIISLVDNKIYEKKYFKFNPIIYISKNLKYSTGNKFSNFNECTYKEVTPSEAIKMLSEKEDRSFDECVDFIKSHLDWEYTDVDYFIYFGYGISYNENSKEILCEDIKDIQYREDRKSPWKKLINDEVV